MSRTPAFSLSLVSLLALTGCVGGTSVTSGPVHGAPSEIIKPVPFARVSDKLPKDDGYRLSDKRMVKLSIYGEEASLYVPLSADSSASDRMPLFVATVVTGAGEKVTCKNRRSHTRFGDGDVNQETLVCEGFKATPDMEVKALTIAEDA